MALVPDIDLKRKVLGQYGRAVTHMRQRIAVDRFGLVVGAGAVVDLGFPK